MANFGNKYKRCVIYPIAQIDPQMAQVIQPDLCRVWVTISAWQLGHRRRVGLDPTWAGMFMGVT